MKNILWISILVVLFPFFGCGKEPYLPGADWVASIPQPQLNNEGKLVYQFLEDFRYVGYFQSEEKMYPFQGVYRRSNSKLYLYNLQVGYIEEGEIDSNGRKIILEQATLENRKQSSIEREHLLTEREAAEGLAGLNIVLENNTCDFNSSRARSVSELVKIFKDGINNKTINKVSQYILPVQESPDYKQGLHMKLIATAYSPFLESINFEEASSPMDKRALEAKGANMKFQVVGHAFCKFQQISHGWLIVKHENEYFFVM